MSATVRDRRRHRRNEVDLAAQNAAGGIHLAGRQHRARLAGRPPQAGGAALRQQERDAQAIGASPHARQRQVEPVAPPGDEAGNRTRMHGVRGCDHHRADQYGFAGGHPGDRRIFMSLRENASRPPRSLETDSGFRHAPQSPNHRAPCLSSGPGEPPGSPAARREVPPRACRSSNGAFSSCWRKRTAADERADQAALLNHPTLTKMIDRMVSDAWSIAGPTARTAAAC